MGLVGVKRTGRAVIVALATAALAVGLVACGGDDEAPSDDDGEATPEMTETVDSTATSDTTSTATTESTTETAATPPAEDSGTITIAGETMEVAAADFGICETVNPAFADDINIVVDIPESDESLRLNGTLGEMDEEHSGMFIRSGDLSQEERAEDLDVSRDGRVVTASGTFERGVVEVEFSC